MDWLALSNCLLQELFTKTKSQQLCSQGNLRFEQWVRRDTRLFLRKGLTYCNHENLKHSRFKQKLGIKMRLTLSCYICSEVMPSWIQSRTTQTATQKVGKHLALVIRHGLGLPEYSHQQLYSFQCGITQPIYPSFLCTPREESNLDWTRVERKGCVTGDTKLADCSQFQRSAAGKLVREMERKHASVNKSEEFKSYQMGMHGGVYLYINQLCKVESIFWEISTSLKIPHLWLLTINSKKKDQRTSSYIFTRMWNRTYKAGCHNFSGVCPIFGLHLFQKSG